MLFWAMTTAKMVGCHASSSEEVSATCEVGNMRFGSFEEDVFPGPSAKDLHGGLQKQQDSRSHEGRTGLFVVR